MSYDLTYQRYNALTSDVKIEVKRINSDGNYESTWKNIDDLLPGDYMAHNSITSLNYSLPQDSFSFGVLNIPNTTVKLISINGEFADQNNTNSIFSGFVRHESQMKISQGYLDPDTGSYDYLETYFGFIDEKSKNTKVSNDNTYQNLYIEDALTYLLKKYTFSDITTTSTILSDMLFELFNRSEFTDFLTVDANNINPGYDVQNIDYTEVEGQTQWLKILQDLSIGHSYLFQKEATLIYQSINRANSNKNAGTNFEIFDFQDDTTFLFQDSQIYNYQSKIPFAFDATKIIKFNAFNTGVDDVYEKLYWKDTAISFSAPTNLYNKSKTFDIETITNDTDRLNVLTQIGTRTSRARKKFKLKVLLYININILDKVFVTAGDYINDDDSLWDLSNWDEDDWTTDTGASSVSSSSFQVVKKITHNFSAGTTDLLLEEI